MVVQIRQIREPDIDGFYETFAIVCRERRYLAFLDPPPIEQTRAFVRRNIETGNPQLVAIDGPTVAGWCDVVAPGRDVMNHVGILGIALHPDWHGRGLGERLMRDAIEAAWSFGLRRIELGVFSHNVRAQALYRKLGFAEEGIRRKRIQIDGIFHDEVMMAMVRD